MVQPFATVTFPVLSALDSFRAPADWTRESFNSKSVFDS
jgi:hypothetical protein